MFTDEDCRAAQAFIEDASEALHGALELTKTVAPMVERDVEEALHNLDLAAEGLRAMRGAGVRVL